MITKATLVRMPEELYEILREDAFMCHTSMNKTIISALREYLNAPEKDDKPGNMDRRKVPQADS